MDAWRFVHMVDDTHLDPSAASILIIGVGIVALAGFPLGAKAANRFGRIRTVAAALVANVTALAFAFLGPPAHFWAPWIWFSCGFIIAIIASNVITVASNTAINELFAPRMRATMMGALLLAGAVGRVGAQILVAMLAPFVGGVATAVGLLLLLGLPVAAVLFRILPDRAPNARSIPSRARRGR